MSSSRRVRFAVSLGILLFFSVLAVGSSGGSSSTDTSSTVADLNAKVTLSGATLSVTNDDSFDWSEVKFELNSQGLKSGYTYRVATVKAGQTVKLSLSDFTLGDGTRFNVLTTKPLNFGVWCKVPKGGNGSWYGGWK